MFTDEQSKQMIFCLLDFSPGTLTNFSATEVLVRSVRVPSACVLMRMDLVYDTEAGTTPALTAELKKGSTVLLSVQATTAATVASDTTVTAGQSLERDPGEKLDLYFTSVNADNDFTAVGCQVWAYRRL